MNRNVKKIENLLRELKPILRKKFNVKEIGIFGSYLKGQATEESDLDILVDFNKSISLLKFIEMENYLSDRVGIKVDLVMKDALKPRIGKIILKEVVNV